MNLRASWLALLKSLIASRIKFVQCDSYAHYNDDDRFLFIYISLYSFVYFWFVFYVFSVQVRLNSSHCAAGRAGHEHDGR
jgi:hypothetical protein